jgi:hypothetical protein
MVILHQAFFFNLRDTMITRMKVNHLFSHLPRDLCIGASVGQGGTQFEYQPHSTEEQLEQPSSHLDATGSPPIPYYGHSWIFGLGDEAYLPGLTYAAHGISSKLAKNVSGNLVSILRTKSGIRRGCSSGP